MRPLLVAASLALVACAPSPPPPASAQLVLGATDASGTFTPYHDGDDVELVAGAQGGFHVWMSYRLDGVPAGEVRLERRASRVGDGQLVLRYDDDEPVGAPDGDGWFQPADPLRMFMCPSPIGLSVIATPIRFSLTFLDGDATLATSAITLVAHCPADQADFCQRICTG